MEEDDVEVLELVTVRVEVEDAVPVLELIVVLDTIGELVDVLDVVVVRVLVEVPRELRVGIEEAVGFIVGREDRLAVLVLVELLLDVAVRVGKTPSPIRFR